MLHENWQSSKNLFGKRFINKFFKQIKILKAIIYKKKTTTQPLNDNPILKALLDT